ncbi:hypothetical protein HZA33_03730 [Candidatus Pacearchaeota archaeon]|nr:hypothetical protein [Candidatus Pacearchaeota archaeon]
MDKKEKYLKRLDFLIDCFMKQLPEMLKQHEGKWIVMGEEKPLGFYETDEEAYEAAIHKYYPQPFLLRKVDKEFLEHGKYGKPVDMGMPSIGDIDTGIKMILN